MPIKTREWREEIGMFNSCKCKIEWVHSNFLANLSLYKLITFILLCCSHKFLGYGDCFDKVLDFPLILILITDNFAIQEYSLIIPVIAVYKIFKTKLPNISCFLQYCLILNHFIELSLNILLQHGTIGTNLGTRAKCSQYFSFRLWNLNSLPAHNLAKVALFQVFNTLHKFKLICLSETYLDSPI